MRIAFVTQWFPPEPGAVVSSSIADGLAARGHTVDVLTGFPNYPTGRLYEGYPLRLYRRDARSDAVTVHRAPLYPSHDLSSAKRMVNYLTFGVAASWIARTKMLRPDVWLTYSSPATSVLPALTVPARLRAPSYLIIQDLWPDSVTGSGFVEGRIGRAMEIALHRFCNWTYRKSTGVGVISPSMRQILIERGVGPEKIYSTPNWVDDRHLLPRLLASDELRRTLGLPSGRRLFMYAGNMGFVQGLEPLVEAFGRSPDVDLVLVGDGVARATLQGLASRQGMRNVHFVGSQPTDRIGEFIAASDLQIVSLKDTPLLRATMPSKVQTSMAAGKPILAHAAGDVADVVTSSGAGVSINPGDVDGAAEAIRMLGSLPSDGLLAMGRRGRTHYEQNFSQTAGLDRMEKMLTTIVDTRRNN